jgi:hypothetical protein
MKLTPQALQRLIKEELEVILTDDEAAELFGDRLKEMLMEITDAEWRAIQAASVRPGSLTPPPEWAIDQWHRSPEGVRYGTPQSTRSPVAIKPHRSDWAGRTGYAAGPHPEDTRTGLKPRYGRPAHPDSPSSLMRKRAMAVPPTEAEKHAYIIQKRAEQEAAERNLGRTLGVDPHADKKGVFRSLRAKAWDAEKKAASDRLNQAVLSGDDARPPKASRAKAYAAAKAEYMNLMADRAAKETARVEWLRSMNVPAAEALDADLLGPADEMRAERHRARMSGRIASDVPRPGIPSWVNQGRERIGKVRGIDVGPAGTEVMSRVPIDTLPAPEGYSSRGATTVPGVNPEVVAAQRKARRGAVKAALKKYGAGALRGADLAFAIEAGYLGGKWAQDPLSRPSQLRKKMGLAGGIPLIQDAPEYIQSGEGFIDPPRHPDDPLYDPKWTPEKSVKHAGGWGITGIDTSAPITKYVASQLRDKPAPTPVRRKAGKAADDPEYLAKRQAEREAGMRARGYDPDDAASLKKANWDVANYVARESLTPDSLRQMIMEEVASLLTEDEVPKFSPHQMSFGVPPGATKVAWSDAPEMQQSAKIQVKAPHTGHGRGGIHAQVQQTRSAAEKLPSYARREYYNELNRLDRLVNTYKYGGEGTMASRYTGPSILNKAEIADAAMKHTKEFMGPEAVAKWEAYEAGRKAAGIPSASEDLFGAARQLKADWRAGGYDAIPKAGRIGGLSGQWYDEYQRLIVQGAGEDLRQKHMRDWTKKRLAGLPQFEAPAAEALEAAAAARAQPPADLPSLRPTSRPPSRLPKGKGPAAIAGGAGYLGAAELGARTGLLPTKSSGEGYGIADLPLAFGGVGSTEADVSTLQANPEKGWNPDKSDEWNLALGRIRNESLTPANLRRMVMEELGFGEKRNHRRNKMARRKNTKRIDPRYFLKENSQLELPGMEAPALCEPADGVDDLSSQLAQMVVDSGMPPEALNDLMELIYDKVAGNLEGIGVEDADDYQRTTMGFMEALRKGTLDILKEPALIEAVSVGSGGTYMSVDDDSTDTGKTAAAAAARQAAGSEIKSPQDSGDEAADEEEVAAANTKAMDEDKGDSNKNVTEQQCTANQCVAGPEQLYQGAPGEKERSLAQLMHGAISSGTDPKEAGEMAGWNKDWGDYNKWLPTKKEAPSPSYKHGSTPVREQKELARYAKLAGIHGETIT